MEEFSLTRKNEMNTEVHIEKSKARNLKIISSAVSHTGAVHTVNEDSFLEKPEIGLWAIADGVGGHNLAKTASRVVVDNLKSLSFNLIQKGNSNDKIKQKLIESNLYLYKLAEQTLSGGTIGSTVVVLYFYAGHYYVFWAGDSRCYLHRNQKLQLLTKDHSQFENQIRAGKQFDEYEMSNKLSNILSRAVGVRAKLEIDMVSGKIEDEDIFWLCSDGGLKSMMESEIQDLMNSKSSMQFINDSIIYTSLKRKVSDNITSIIIEAKMHNE